MRDQPSGRAMKRGFMRVHIIHQYKYGHRRQLSEGKGFLTQFDIVFEAFYMDGNHESLVLCGAV